MKKARLGLGLVLALLVVLSGQAGVHAQAGGPPITVTGTFAMLSGDPLDGGEHRYVYTVTDDDSREHRVAMADGVGAAAGGVTNLTGKRVTVTGTVQGAPQAGGPSTIAASAVKVEGTAPGAPSAAPEALSGPQAFVTILCRFSDSTGTTPRSVAYVEGLLGDSYPGISHFWRENSFNLINNVGSVVKGWYNLPQPRSYYVPGGDLDFGRAARDCTALANPTVNFNNYVGINLLFNQSLDCCAWGGSWTLTLDGTTKAWPMTWMPPWGYSDQAVLGHEMGHAYGLPHSSGNYGAVYDSRWDVMSWGGRALGTPHAIHGRLGTHTISYHKDKLAWIPAARRYEPAANTCRDISIDHLEQVPATSGNYLMAKIPVTATRFYTVEARKNKGYDNGRLPGEAVLIHDVDTTRREPAHVMDATNDNNPNDAGAMWLPGETFTDNANGVKVQVLSATADGWLVRITRGSGVCATTPPAPTLISPSGTGIANPVTYRWNASTGATWYRLYVSGPGGVREAWFSASAAGCSGGGVCQVKPSGTAENSVPWALADGSYTWWARGWASNVNGPWSAGKSFTVGPPVAPVLVSPSGTAAPNPVTYRWNAAPGASWYRLFVGGPGGNRAQWFTASSAGCPSGTGACQLTPTGNAESSVPWQLASGSYTWWVMAFNSEGTSPWSAPKSFTGVFGFDSQFNANAVNWLSRQGTWNHVSGAYLTTTGVANQNASVYYGNVQFANFTYEARLWRNGSNLANKLFLRGQPATLASNGDWSNTYQFSYTRDGQYSVWRTVNGSTSALQSWSFSSAIVQGSAWNVLRVTVSGTGLSFSINGTTVWSGSDPSFAAGYAGISMFSDGTAGNQLWVDYAKLTTPVGGAPLTSEQPAATNQHSGGTPDRPAGSSGSAGAQAGPAVATDGPGDPVPSA